jgi:flagellar basal-body rod protein FlgF
MQRERAMENATLIGLSRQMALSRELDVIANNMANASTNGFKARTSRFKEFMMPKASADTFPLADRRLSYVIDDGNPVDFSTGNIERTGSPLDVAVRGDGYLVVQTPAGERYTRNGSLEIDQKGQLVNSDGFAVVGDSGPITFGNTETGFNIGADGTVSSSQGQRGRLRLVRFADPRTLKNEGANTFSSTAAAESAVNKSSLESGAVERSNVKPVLEMSRLIYVNRTYQSIASLMQNMDQLRQTAISRLADVPA